MRWALILAVLLCASAPALAAVVREVAVEGTRRVEPATVLSYADIAAGQDLTEAERGDALSRVYASGLFSDVRIGQSGGRVTISVVESPVINQIAFEGNDKVKDDDLAQEIALGPRQVLSPAAVAADTERIAEIYRRRGRYAATITPQVIALDEGRANLVFEIDEGPVAKISRVAFVGNEAFSDSDLRGRILTRQHAWWRFFTSVDRFDPDRMRFDETQLRDFYLSRGYADMAVTSSLAELADDRRSFVLTFTIDEGPRYRVSAVRIESATAEVPEPDYLLEHAAAKAGKWYNADHVTRSIDEITEALVEGNHVFVAVDGGLIRDPGQAPDVAEPTGTVLFRLTPAPKVYIERIEITGNSRTHDDVIRRQIDVVEGDPLSRARLDRARRDVADLGYFKDVRLDVRPGSAPGLKTVEIAVVEQSTGDISVGAGYSTIDGVLADFRIRERNILGKGYIGHLGFSISQGATQFDVGLADPHFLNRDLLAGIELFHTTRDLQDESSFDQKRTGGALRAGYPLGKYWRQTLKYRLEDNKIENVKSTASRYIREQEGSRTTSAISQRLTYDRRDSRINPTEGWYYWLDAEVAGIGGDAKYVSGTTGASLYHSIVPEWVVALTGEGGAIEGYNDDTPTIAERFYMGGYKARGFKKGGLGPRDLSTDDALGGKYFMRSTVELTMPIGGNSYGLKGHVFSDAGTLWGLDAPESSDPNIVDDLEWRASVGVGLSWDSPIGPVRVDVADAVVKEDYDKTESFRFSFGSSF